MTPSSSLLDSSASSGNEQSDLKKDVNWLASFPETNPNPILEVDLGGLIQYANPAVRRLFPTLLDQGTAHPYLGDWKAVMERFYKEPSLDLVRDVVVEGRAYQQAIYYVERYNHLRVYGRDITVRKKAEEALLDTNTTLQEQAEELEIQAEELQNQNEELALANERLSQLITQLEEQRRLAESLASEAQQRADEMDTTFSALAEAIIVYGTDRKVQRVNPAAIQALGFDPTRKDITGLLHRLSSRYPDGRLVKLSETPTERALVGEHVRNERFILTNTEGRDMTIIVSSSPLAKDGQIVGAVTVWRDVTEREQLLNELITSQRTLSLFVENAPAAIAMFDRNMNYLAASRRYLADYHLPEQNLVGRNHYDVFPEIPERWKEIHRRCLAGAVEKAEEDPFPREDGTLDWVKWEIHPWYETTGEIGGIILLSEVITERKNEKAELLRLNRTLTAHSKSSQAMLHAEDESSYLQEVCRIITEDCGHAMVWIGYGKNDAAKSVKPVASAGFEEGYLKTLRITWADKKRGHGPTGTAIRTGEVRMCRNMLTDPAFAPWREYALQRGYASSIALPLKMEGETFGALTIYSREPDPFTPHEIDLLSEIANDLGYGIARLRQREKDERNQRILDAVIQQMPAGIIITDATGSNAKNNLEMDRIWRRSMRPDENIAAHAYQAVHADGSVYSMEEWPLTRSLEKGEIVVGEEMTIQRGDGTTGVLHVSSAPIRGKGGEMIAGVVIDVDITERKLLEERLKESERKYRELVQHAPAAIYEMDFRSRRFTSVNDGMCQLTGYSREELLQMDPFEIMDEASKLVFLKRTSQWLAGEQPVDTVEYKVRAKDGRDLYALLNTTFITDINGKPLSATVVAHDITVRRHAEVLLQKANAILQEQAEILEQRVRERTQELENANEELELAEEELKIQNEELEKTLTVEKSLRLQLIQSEKYAALARLVGSVAHEINNPIQTVKNCLYLIRCEELPQEAMVTLDMADSELQRMSNLVKSLRETYRPSNLQPVNFDLVEMLHKIAGLLAPQMRQSNVRWQLDAGQERIIMHGIPDQIQQVCLNICLNAIDAMGSAGGWLSVAVEPLPEQNRVAISFHDSGPGISSQVIDQIFEPFFTTKAKGTGLGLSICYEIVKAHGGEIGVESVPGEGAIFTVRLPTEIFK